MAPKISISDLPPVPWVRERDVDLLLAELLSTEPSLTSWIIDRDRRHGATAPSGVPCSVQAVVNYSRPDAVGGATGETDVVVSADYLIAGGTLLLSIEDKVWAAPQRNQGARHRAYVDGQPATWGLAVLIAPRDWISGRPCEVDHYHLDVSLEDLAQWCDEHDFGFQASVFRQACTPPDFDVAPDLQDWHLAVDNLLAGEFGLRLAPQNYVRTRNHGKAKPNRWASCALGTLESIPGTESPQLRLKPASTNHPSRAAIEAPKASHDLVEAVSVLAVAHGFDVRVTSAGTLLVERYVPDAMAWTVTAPFEDQVDHLVAVGRAAMELCAWWNSMALDDESPGE